MVNAIIMASGLSKRMGENKLLLKYKGIYLVEHVLKEVNKSKFNEVILVSQYEDVLKLGEKYKFKIIKNNNFNIGQSESIRLGIENSSKCDGYMFFVGDQPEINSQDINRLLSEFENNKGSIVMPRYENKSGNPVIFPYEKKYELLLLKGDEKGKKVINGNSHITYVDVGDKVLFDIDTKEDYEKIRGD